MCGSILTGCSIEPPPPPQAQVCDKGPDDSSCAAQPVEFDNAGTAFLVGEVLDDLGFTFDLGPLRAGDRIIIDVDTPQSDLDAKVAIFDEAEGLFRVNDDEDTAAGIVDPFIDEVIRHPSNNYFLVIARSPFGADVFGSYDLHITVERGGPVPERPRQTVLLDFDGGTVTTNDGLVLTVGAFDAGNIDPIYSGLTTEIETCLNTCFFATDGECDDGGPDAEFSGCDLGTDCDDCGGPRSTSGIRDFIIEFFALNFEQFDVLILNTFEHVPPADGNFSTVLFGGSSAQFSGVDPLTFGLAVNGTDPYNRDLTDDAIIFTDSFKPEVFASPPSPRELGLVIGNVASHEVGHLLGLEHDDGFNSLMLFVNPTTFLEDPFFLDFGLEFGNFGIVEFEVFQFSSSMFGGETLFCCSQNKEQLLREVLGEFPGPVSLVAVDLDGDGDVDLATANKTSDNVSILLNDGSGTFFVDDSYEAGNSPSELTAGDIDGDGDVDLVPVLSFRGGVNVLHNAENATFSAPSVHIETQTGPGSVALADLDGDGDLDLLASEATFDHELFVFRNDGDGTFGEPVATDLGLGPIFFGSALTIADLDGDGDLDLAATTSFSELVSFLLNDGDGTFTAAGTVGVGLGDKSFAPADLDGDGDLDLVVAQGRDPPTEGTVRFLLNNGDASFAGAGILSFPPDDLNTLFAAIQAGDLDGDGDVDFAILDKENPFGLVGAIVVLLNDNDEGEFVSSSFTGIVVTLPQRGIEPSDLKLADFDGDGDLDIAVTVEGLHGVLMLFNPGDGDFGDLELVPIGPT